MSVLQSRKGSAAELYDPDPSGGIRKIELAAQIGENTGGQDAARAVPSWINHAFLTPGAIVASFAQQLAGHESGALVRMSINSGLRAAAMATGPEGFTGPCG